MVIEKLEENHLSLLDAFHCTENKEELAEHKSDVRRKIIKHSKEMEDFLRDEALSEQTKNLNTTHLFFDDSSNKLIGYVSLCNDSIRLEFDERDELELTYTTVPAVKIARLAIDNEYKNQGYGKLLIEFSIYSAVKMRELSGITFITLDCYSHRQSYYEHMGFVKNQIQPDSRLYDTPISMRLVINDYLDKIVNDE